MEEIEHLIELSDRGQADLTLILEYMQQEGGVSLVDDLLRQIKADPERLETLALTAIGACHYMLEAEGQRRGLGPDERLSHIRRVSRRSSE